MKQHGAIASRAWAGWMILGIFATLMAKVAVTGSGDGPQPLPPEKQPRAATPVGSLAWVEAEFHRLEVLATDEHLVSGYDQTWPNCKLIIVGPGGTYGGRVCESNQGLYRLNADASASPLYWQYDAQGNWTVSVRESRQVAS